MMDSRTAAPAGPRRGRCIWDRVFSLDPRDLKHGQAPVLAPKRIPSGSTLRVSTAFSPVLLQAPLALGIRDDF